MVSFKDLLATSGKIIETSQLGRNPTLTAVAPPESCSPGDLVFANMPEQIEIALARGCGALICSNKVKESLTNLPADFSWATVAHVPLAMASILKFFDSKWTQYEPGVHPTAFVHPQAQLGNKVSIGPFAVIGAQAKLGDQVVVGAHAVIEAKSQIGQGSIVHAGAVVAFGCEVGQYCELHSNCVIGSDGYGYATDGQKIHHKIPQIGIVKLGNFVEVGANTAIDRATLSATTVGDHTKIDNLCHIAHNCTVGVGCFITANFAMAGSSHIGDYFVCGGSTSVGDHVHIPAHVQLAGATVVTSSLQSGGSYGGNPVQPMRDYLKTRANQAHLTRLRKQVAQILKALNIQE